LILSNATLIGAVVAVSFVLDSLSVVELLLIVIVFDCLIVKLVPLDDLFVEILLQMLHQPYQGHPWISIDIRDALARGPQSEFEDPNSSII
jgi:hypothetical protein